MRQQGEPRSIRQALELPGVEDIEVEWPRLEGITRSAELG